MEFRVSTASPELIKSFDLGKLAPPVFFRSPKEIEESTEPHPYSHLMRRAWESMRLNGILCVDRIPTVYFKEVKRINSSQLRDLQRQLWNQGTATMLVVSSPKAVEVYSGLAYPAREGEEVKDDNRLVETLASASGVRSWVGSGVGDCDGATLTLGSTVEDRSAPEGGLTTSRRLASLVFLPHAAMATARTRDMATTTKNRLDINCAPLPYWSGYRAPRTSRAVAYGEPTATHLAAFQEPRLGVPASRAGP